MPTFTYLVTVETERDAGMIAGREDQSIAITEALESGAEQASMSGLGFRGDSEYSVSNVSVEELEAKEAKALNTEYDQAVFADQPGDASLRNEIRLKVEEIRNLLRENQKLERQVEGLTATREQGATKIWIEDYVKETKEYISDDRKLTFSVGGDRETCLVTRSVDGSIELHYQGFGQLRVSPRSGNVVIVDFKE